VNNIEQKILSLESDELIKITASGNVALCYGHFNLIHPGHLRYLQHATTLADILVIGIIPDQDLEEDIGSHYFSEFERAQNVASLHFADYVVILSDHTSLQKLVEKLQPNVMVLGNEFEYARAEQLTSAINILEKNRGKVVFHAGEAHYASAELLHGSVVDIENDKRVKFNRICKDNNITLDGLLNRMNSFNSSNLLVIGDTIIDHYVACDALGMSAEAPVLVVKELEAREFVGGAGVVAAHVNALGAKCHFLSVVGDDEQSMLAESTLVDQGVETHFITDSSRPTTYKTRYMVENQKLFRVSRLKDHKLSKKNEDLVIDKIMQLAPNLDGILISDFIYGVITDRVLETIQNLADKFDIKLYGDLQCSSQVGNVTKFVGFHLITPTEKEARIALDDHESGIEWMANKLLDDVSADNLLMKLGSDGFIAYKKCVDDSLERQHFPALSANPVDVAGAGDSLFATMAVCLSSGSSLVEAATIATCVASLAVQEVGNIPVSYDKLTAQIKGLLTNY